MKLNLFKIKTLIRSIQESKLALSFGIATLLALVSLNTSLFRVEAFFYDLRMRLKGSEALHSDISLILIRDQQKEGQPEVEDSLENHLLALRKLMAQKPKAIIYLNKFDPVDIETKPDVADKFVALAQKAEAQGTRIYFGTDVDMSGEVLPPYPLSLLPHFPSILSPDGRVFAEDNVIRRASLTAFDEPSLHLRVAYPDLSREDLLASVKNIRGSYFHDLAKDWFFLIQFPASTTLLADKYPHVEFSDIVKDSAKDSLSGKILLVHPLRNEGLSDFAYTPYSRTMYANPKAYVHAAILDSLLKNKGLVTAHPFWDSLITFLLALVLAFIAISKSPSRGVAALVSLAALLFFSSLLLFRFGVWLPIVHPVLAMFFTYYLIVPYRAILEYKKRWEVQEKHDLLVQVEEMKGNFLSLMSHDLKTPVARIQGLAEMVLRQGGLLPAQEDELQQIIASTENLDKFISKILNLTKVESNEIKLNKKSKDVNKLIEQCVQKLEFQAHSKDIGVQLELDPLFPIQVDASLIIQVFTNIIDNAIKYSPSGSIVTIRSRETNDFVEVQITDNGTGLEEKEVGQLFTKFFRGRSIPGDQIKGSGLGLYLSKYFIEMHEGSIHATSQRGAGTCFTIQLPIEGGQV